MRLRSAFYTVLFLVSIVAAMLLLVFGNQVHDLIIRYVPLLKEFSGFIISVRTIATITLLTLLFMAMYKLLPNRKDRFANLLPGGLFTALAWSIFSYGFTPEGELIPVDDGKKNVIHLRKSDICCYGNAVAVFLHVVYIHWC